MNNNNSRSKGAIFLTVYVLYTSFTLSNKVKFITHTAQRAIKANGVLSAVCQL